MSFCLKKAHFIEKNSIFSSSKIKNEPYFHTLLPFQNLNIQKKSSEKKTTSKRNGYFLRNRVIAMPSARATFRQTLQRQPSALKDAILLYRNNGVLRASGREPARRRRERRDAITIKIYRKQEQFCESPFQQSNHFTEAF
jgi:hypothetical protein